MISLSPTLAHPMGGDRALRDGNVIRPQAEAHAGAHPRIFFGGANGNVKVMSYNCQRFFRDYRGELQKPENSVARLGRIIRGEDPDIICLQEVGDKALLAEFNRQHLGGRYAHIIVSGPPESRGSQVAILCKPGLRPVQTKEYRRGLTHPLLMATLVDNKGRRTTVFNAHFKAPRPSLQATAEKRLSEARIAAALIQERLAAHPDEDLILAGDLNTPYDRRLGRPVIQTLSGLPVDAKKAVTPEALRSGMMIEPFLTQSDALPNKAVDTHRMNSHRGKLDYIWVSPGLYDRVTSARVVGSFRNRYFRRTSDHLPVTVEYTPKPAVAKPQFGGRLNRIA